MKVIVVLDGEEYKRLRQDVIRILMTTLYPDEDVYTEDNYVSFIKSNEEEASNVAIDLIFDRNEDTSEYDEDTEEVEETDDEYLEEESDIVVDASYLDDVRQQFNKWGIIPENIEEVTFLGTTGLIKITLNN